jgi:hypothetical protein
MQNHTIPLLLTALPTLLISHVCFAAQDGAWQEDLRRCMIYKPIEGGRVVIANDEGTLEIDVQRDGTADGGTDGQKYMIAFDNGMAVSKLRRNPSRRQREDVAAPFCCSMYCLRTDRGAPPTDPAK